MAENDQISYRALMSIPAARRLALAAIPADFSDWLDYAAVVALLVFVWGEGPFILALFAFCLTLPYVVIGPLVAVIVDRVPLRPLLFVSNLGRALATLALVFAPGTVAILIIVFLRASIDSAFGPARQAAIQATTPSHLLAKANGLHHAINQISKIAGPALGGLLLTMMSVQTVMVLNVVVSLLAAVIILGVRIQPRATDANVDATSFRETFLAGIVEFKKAQLAAALTFSAGAYFCFFLYDALIAILTEDLGLGVALFGLGISASGAGGVLGALLAGGVAANKAIRSMGAAALITGIVAAFFGIAWFMRLEMVPPLYLAGLALLGGSTAFMLVPYRTIVQTHTPEDRIARVFAAGDAITMAVMLSAPFLGSAIAAHYGVGAAFLAGGVLIGMLGLISLMASMATKPIQGETSA